jgi:ADP-heptose:LPS heptosyltransferase
MLCGSLVLVDGALGDTVLVWPTLRALAPLTLVGPGGKAALAQAWLDGVIGLDQATGGWELLHAEHEAGQNQTEAAQRLSCAELVVHFGASPDRRFRENLERLAPRARVVFVRSRPPPDALIHVAAFHRRQLEEAGIDCAPIHPPARRNPGGPILVAPGSGGRAKCWAPERFEKLAGLLEARGWPVTFVTGYVEREWMEPSRSRHWRERYAMVAPETPLALSQLIAQARALVGNDSGTTHLAAQLGIPTIALFGPTDPRCWSPVGPAVSIVSPESPRAMSWLEVERAYESVVQALGPN